MKTVSDDVEFTSEILQEHFIQNILSGIFYQVHNSLKNRVVIFPGRKNFLDCIGILVCSVLWKIKTGSERCLTYNIST